MDTEGQPPGETLSRRDISLDAVVGLIHGTLDSMVLTRWGMETVEQLGEAGEHVIEILFGGIGTRKE